MDQFAIGVDLGGTNLRIAAIDHQGQILDSVDTLTEVSHGREATVARLTETVRFISRKFSSSSTVNHTLRESALPRRSELSAHLSCLYADVSSFTWFLET